MKYHGQKDPSLLRLHPAAGAGHPESGEPGNGRPSMEKEVWLASSSA